MYYVLILLIVLLPSIYLFNYAKYEWTKNKSAAVGALLLIFVVIVLVVVALPSL